MNQLKNALWMHERGHDVVVICKFDSPFEKSAKEAGLGILNIGSHKKYFDFKAGKKLANLIDENRITHLIVRDTRDMSLAVIAKRKAKNKIHLSYFMEMQLGVKKKNIFHTIRFTYFDLWSCPLNWLATQVETMTLYNKSRIKVIPSGLDLSSLETSMSKSDARKVLSLPEDKIIFGLIGRFDPHKGQLLLLEALSKLNDTNLCICLLGEPTRESDSSYFDAMTEMIKRFQLDDQVFIRPFRKDISTFFRAIDAFIMASKAETFGMVTIESMACGTPVIASNAGGSPEILNNGEFGFLFETLNAESLSERLKNFKEDSKRISSEHLRTEAKKYDHHLVCSMVEEALGL